MAKTARRKLGLAIKASLYDALSKLAKRNGQTRSFLLEKALEHYLQVVVPSESTVRPEVMEHFRRSTDRNRELHRLLAR
jgi:predicted DNA-binding protein